MPMKKMIVTGCRGQLGIAINKLYEGNREIELVNTDVEELDIKDIDKVMAFVREIKPYAIINCAAHTNVNACAWMPHTPPTGWLHQTLYRVCPHFRQTHNR